LVGKIKDSYISFNPIHDAFKSAHECLLPAYNSVTSTKSQF